MGYVGMPVFQGAELTSIRRLREGGPGSGRHKSSGKSKDDEKSKRGYGEGQVHPNQVAKDAEKAAAYLKTVPRFHSTAVVARNVAAAIRERGEVTQRLANKLSSVYDQGNAALERHEDRYGQTSRSDKALDHLDKLLDHAEAYGAKEPSGKGY